MRTQMIAVVVASTAGLAAGQTTFFGPETYAGMFDSPLMAYGDVQLEDFEDGVFDLAGATLVSGADAITSAGPYTDSVESSEGGPGGGAATGRSLFVLNADGAGLTINFADGVNGVGFVYTDGNNGAMVTVEAFDLFGNSLGTVEGSTADGTGLGGTSDDAFYGVFSETAIGSLQIRTVGGFEIDHIQTASGALIPAPGAGLIAGLGLIAAGRRRR